MPSPTGEIIGNASWVSLDQSAVCFQKGNIGVKIFNPLSHQAEDLKNLSFLSNEILMKIENSLNEKIEEATGAGEKMIVLCSPVIRHHFKRLTEKFIPNLTRQN